MTTEDLRIAVVSGGDSAEAGVSRKSAAGVIEALNRHCNQITGIELNADMADSLAAWKPDIVFPILHGPPGEDGTFQGFMEILGYSYVGSGVAASAFAMNKVIAKDIFRHAGLPVARQCVLTRDGFSGSARDRAETLARIVGALGESVVVKPASQGSAIGVTLTDEAGQLADALDAGFQHDPQLLIEERVNGREMTVGVMDVDAGTAPFPVIEITTPEGKWYDFEHRYTPGWSEHLMPADITEDQARRLQACAVSAHQALGCRDLSRADFILKDDDIYLLEVNTLPGMTETSLYPDGARGYGLDFPELVRHLAERAAARACSDAP